MPGIDINEIEKFFQITFPDSHPNSVKRDVKDMVTYINDKMTDLNSEFEKIVSSNRAESDKDRDIFLAIATTLLNPKIKGLPEGISSSALIYASEEAIKQALIKFTCLGILCSISENQYDAVIKKYLERFNEKSTVQRYESFSNYCWVSFQRMVSE